MYSFVRYDDCAPVRELERRLFILAMNTKMSASKLPVRFEPDTLLRMMSMGSHELLLVV